MVNAFDLTADVIATSCQLASNSHRVVRASFGENPDLLIFSALRSRVQVWREQLPGHPAIQPGECALIRKTGGVMMFNASRSDTLWPRSGLIG